MCQKTSNTTTKHPYNFLFALFSNSAYFSVLKTANSPFIFEVKFVLKVVFHLQFFNLKYFIGKGIIHRVHCIRSSVRRNINCMIVLLKEVEQILKESGLQVFFTHSCKTILQYLNHLLLTINIKIFRPIWTAFLAFKVILTEFVYLLPFWTFYLSRISKSLRSKYFFLLKFWNNNDLAWPHK